MLFDFCAFPIRTPGDIRAGLPNWDSPRAFGLALPLRCRATVRAIVAQTETYFLEASKACTCST